MKARIIFHGVAVLVLLATVAAAQQPQDKAKQAPAGKSADRESSTPAVSEREAGSGMPTGRRQWEPALSARETGTGMASGRKSGSIIVMNRESADASLNARNSAHATESVSGKMSSVQSNPMYKDSNNQGTNPLYESKDRTAASGGGSSQKPIVEYKDGEVGTLHAQPGNHKTK